MAPFLKMDKSISVRTACSKSVFAPVTWEGEKPGLGWNGLHFLHARVHQRCDLPYQGGEMLTYINISLFLGILWAEREEGTSVCCCIIARILSLSHSPINTCRLQKVNRRRS